MYSYDKTIQKKYIYIYVDWMIIQKTLIDQDSLNKRSVYLKNIKAMFSVVEDSLYDVVLEINSNKFFLSVQHQDHEIQEFQVISIKWFIELNNKLVFLLRQLVNHLFIRLDYA